MKNFSIVSIILLSTIFLSSCSDSKKKPTASATVVATKALTQKTLSDYQSSSLPSTTHFTYSDMLSCNDSNIDTIFCKASPKKLDVQIYIHKNTSYFGSLYDHLNGQAGLLRSKFDKLIAYNKVNPFNDSSNSSKYNRMTAEQLASTKKTTNPLLRLDVSYETQPKKTIWKGNEEKYIITVKASLTDPVSGKQLYLPAPAKMVSSETEFLRELDLKYKTTFYEQRPINYSIVTNTLVSLVNKVVSEINKDAISVLKVSAISDNNILASNGMNVGVTNNETMILAMVTKNFTKTLAMVNASPSDSSTHAKIFKWSDSKLAQKFKKASTDTDLDTLKYPLYLITSPE